MAAFLLFSVLLIQAISPVPMVALAQRLSSIHTGTLTSSPTLQNIRYGEEKEELFDYYRGEGTGVRPWMLYVHGGAFCLGDKERLPLVCRELLLRGVSVVSADFTLAPQATYPTPLKQLTTLCEYLTAQSEHLELDVSRVLIGGESSGGLAAGQFTALQCNENYSRALGIGRSFSPSCVKGVYFGCALFTPSDFTMHGWAGALNYPLFQTGRAYFGCNDVAAEQIVSADLLPLLTPEFPPCFICDGEIASFSAQARRADEILTRLSVPHQCLFTDRAHGYDLRQSRESALTAELAADFLLHTLQTAD